MRFFEEIKEMRAAVGIPIAFAACGLAAVAAQTPQAPVFRSGVELLEVDVSAVDDRGKPIIDLKAPDFVVTVDGKPRRVVSSEYVAEGSVNAPQAAADPYVSNNTDRRPGRLILLVIDQNNITTERWRSALGATQKFVTGLAPDDRVALMAIPRPGPVVDFTANHQQVRDALNNVVGHAGGLDTGRFNISASEALAVADGRDPTVAQQLLIRSCGANIGPRSPCRIEVEQDALQVAQQVHSLTDESIGALGGVLRGLKEIDGPKSLVLISQGLMLDDSQLDTSFLADLAAEARVSVNVLLFDTNVNTASERRASNTSTQDRDLREGGLTMMAARSRGALFRVATNPQYPFDRIEAELSGRYILGVEPAAADRDGKQHDIKVQVARKGASIRSRQQFKFAPRAANWSRDDEMGRVLSSPAPSTEIPMRVTTYAYRNDEAPQSQKVKVIVAAEIDAPTTGDVDVAIGHALYDALGHAVDLGQERKIFSANSDRPLRYDIAILVDPGTYRLRLAVIDPGGNSGSVEREVKAFQMSGELALGDLMLATGRDVQGGEIRPPVLPRVEDGRLQTFTELYTSKSGSLTGTQVTLEVAEGADSPALKTDRASLQGRTDGLSASAVANLSVAALPPGRYVVREVVTSSGRTVGKMVRPFLIVGNGRPAPAAAASAAAPAAAPPNAARNPSGGAGLFNGRQAVFAREDVLQPETLAAAFDAMEKSHPLAKAAIARGRGGQLEGTALMALDAGDQSAGAMLRGLEYLTKGQLDPAATQFGVALRSATDSPLASFYLGACFAAAGKDREALLNWERARAAQLPVPSLPIVIGQAYMRLGQPAQALAPLGEALAAQPQNDAVRKSLAVAQSTLARHDQAFATIAPYLEKNTADADALMVALLSIYQVHADGKSIGAGDQDRIKAALYAKQYAAAAGPNQALVEKWLQFLNLEGTK